MLWNAYGVDTILPAPANHGFHFQLVSVTKMHIHPHCFRFNTGTFKSI